MDTDMTLLDAARSMNGDALVEIFDLYAPVLYKYAFRLCTDALLADQIVGDVIAKLLDQFSSGNGPTSNLRSYLYEMAYHLLVDEVRYLHRTAKLEVVDFFRHDEQSAYRNLENGILFEKVTLAILNDLTNDQRHVLILRFLEGFSLKETAAIIGKEVGNVKVIQNRAIATLRKALDYQAVEIRASSPAFGNFLTHGGVRNQKATDCFLASATIRLIDETS